MSQSPVEWLVEKLEATKILDPYYKETLRIPKLIKHAKQMEEKQKLLADEAIGKAYEEGFQDGQEMS